MRFVWYLMALLFVLNAGIWLAVFEKERAEKMLTVSFLDVGQGDAIFIEAPNGNQLLIDAGKGSAVLRGLGRAMGFFDKDIDAVLATHPDADHIGGFPDVFAHFRVAMVLMSSVADSGNDAQAFERAVKEEGVTPAIAARGMRLVLDKKNGVELRILFPDRLLREAESNMGSIIAQLVYGDTAFLLTGDAPQAIEKYVVEKDGAGLESEVLKLGHHGSKTSTAPEFLSAVSPRIAVVSAGKDNRYGHPHKDVVDRVAEAGTLLFSTAEEGTITFLSDGREVWKKENRIWGR